MGRPHLQQSFATTKAPELGVLGIIVFSIMAIRVAAAAGPSTTADWQRFYAACLQGADAVAGQQALGADFPARFCTCIREDVKNTSENERDARFPGIRDYCIQQAKE